MDINELRKKLEALEDGGPNRAKKEFTPEMDALLLEFWPRKKHKEVSRILGISVGTVLNRYRELTKGGEK